MTRPFPGRLLGVALAACLVTTAAIAQEDHRGWQHGIDLVRVDGKLLLVWGSAGNPPRKPGRNWQHDIHAAWLDDTGEPGPTRVLVSRPEAQEPPSAAINSRGTLLVTSEDGHPSINQQAGLWDRELRVLRRYPLLVRRGGHSGHAAAMGERFLVAYGEGWVAGGAWRDLGTGANLHARIVGNDGSLGREVTIASGRRDSWPLVAGSDRNWLVVWQRYPERTLLAALVDSSGKVVSEARIAGDLPLRYAYDVAYSPELAAYVVVGTSAAAEQGFMALVSLTGVVTRLADALPPFASESRLVMGLEGGQPIAAYPTSPSGVAVVRLTASSAWLAQRIEHPHVWDYTGTAGAFLDPRRLLFATLSTSGLKLVRVDLPPRP